MNKSRFLFSIYLLVILIENISCYSKNKNNTINSMVYNDTFVISGINEQNNIIGYYYGKKNIGKGDIKYQYILYDYKNNRVLAETKQKYIATFYNEECIQTDWNDEKYSYEAFYSFLSDDINKLNAMYDIKSFKISEQCELSSTFNVLNRNSINGLSENISFSISFKYNDQDYIINKTEQNVNILKEVQIYSLYKNDNYIIVLLSKSHVGFEQDDFVDYEIYGLKIK